MVDIDSIGAGGGSVARTRGGALAVGPESMGADPGPACYGRGGTEPTVTDAHVVLGYLGGGGLLGGAMSLDADAAARAVRRGVADPMGLGLHQAAWAILRTAHATMAHAIPRASC